MFRLLGGAARTAVVSRAFVRPPRIAFASARLFSSPGDDGADGKNNGKKADAQPLTDDLFRDISTLGSGFLERSRTAYPRLERDAENVAIFPVRAFVRKRDRCVCVCDSQERSAAAVWSARGAPRRRRIRSIPAFDRRTGRSCWPRPRPPTRARAAQKRCLVTRLFILLNMNAHTK